MTVYARTASGNAAPLRTIQGAATGLSGPISVAVDLDHDELAVANGGLPSAQVDSEYSSRCYRETALDHKSLGVRRRSW